MSDKKDKWNGIELITPIGILCVFSREGKHPLFEPVGSPQNETDMKYRARLWFNKEAIAFNDKLVAEGKLKGPTFAEFKTQVDTYCRKQKVEASKLRDGSINDYYKEGYYMDMVMYPTTVAGAKQQPKLTDNNKLIISSPDAMFSGVFARTVVSIFKGKQGKISALFNAIQKIKDGTPLAVARAHSDIDAVEYTPIISNVIDAEEL